MLNYFLKMSILLIFTFSTNSFADELKAKMLDNNPSYCEIFYYLNGGDVPDDCPPKRRTRSVVKPVKINTVSFSRMINFEFNSAKLKPQSIPTLNKILAVIQSPKMSYKTIRIEGHTDIVGTASYNQRLSERRALSVKRYFTQHGVTPDRITTVGYGFNHLYDKNHPDGGINRRVEFANLGG